MNAPDWAKRVAQTLGDGPHMVVTGISPSGNIHNLREVLTAEAVANALRELGHDVRFIFHADTIDPLRKVAPGIPEDFKRYFGHSLSRIPDPDGERDSYADRFLVPFEEALREMDMDIEVLRSHELYENGVYTDVIRDSIEHADDLRRILKDVSGREMPEEWSPFLPRAASGDMTGNRVIRHLPDENKVVFVDRDGNEGVADYARGEGKLGWRVELAARWKALGVTFEPFGKDHTSRGGSTDTADRMSREVFDYPPPGRYEYEWISIKGQGAMSSSKGIVLLPKDLLQIMPPDALRQMMLGRDPARALELDLGEGFPRFMDEYRDRTEKGLVPFSHLATLAQSSDGNVERVAQKLDYLGYRNDTRDLGELTRNLRYAKSWVDEWAPESYKIKLLSLPEAAEKAQSLSDEQVDYLDRVADRLNRLVSMGLPLDEEAVQDILYYSASESELSPRKAFAAVYTVLIGRTNGPKAGPYISQIGPEATKRFFSVHRNRAANE